MPSVDHLRGLEVPSPEVDADAMLGRIHGQARRRRRQRVAAVAASVLVVVGVVAGVVTGSSSESQVDTAGPAATVPAQPYLPGVVPDGFTMAWADVHIGGDEEPAPPGQVWTNPASEAFSLGYHSENLELEARVYPGQFLDADEVRRVWGPRTEIASDEPGRMVLTRGPVGEVPVLIDFDGGVVLVSPHRLQSADPLSFGSIVAFGRSFHAVDETEWQAAIAGADVAPPIGIRSQQTLIDGDGWRLQGLAFRAPRSTTQPQLRVDFDARASTVRDEPSVSTDPANPESHIEVGLIRNGVDQVIAYGVAPATAVQVRLRFTERTVIAPAVRFADGTAFAADVGTVEAGPRLVEALDESGTTIAALTDQTQAECVGEGQRTLNVPDVLGQHLWDAIRIVEQAGLTVIGTGTPAGDPTGDDAVVTAQTPDDSQQVWPGACVGFRTR